MYYLCYNGARIKLEELNGKDWHLNEVVKAVEKRILEKKINSLEYCIVRSFAEKKSELIYDNRKNSFGVMPEIFRQ